MSLFTRAHVEAVALELTVLLAKDATVDCAGLLRVPILLPHLAAIAAGVEAAHPRQPAHTESCGCVAGGELLVYGDICIL